MGFLCMILVPSTHLHVNKGINGKLTWCAVTDHNKCAVQNVKNGCKKSYLMHEPHKRLHIKEMVKQIKCFVKQQCQIDNKCNILTKFQSDVLSKREITF